MTRASNDNRVEGDAMSVSGEDSNDDPHDDGSSGRDRREWPRVYVDLQVDYGEQDNYLFAYIKDISATGIFIKTRNPEAAGTQLNLRFKPHDGGEELALEGEVIWVNPYRPGDPASLNPGMGIRFVCLTREQRDRLDHFVKTFAYLDG